MAETVIRIAHVGDVGAARQAAKTLAVAIGFSETASEEIAIVVSELAFNLVNHAHGGRLRLSTLAGEGRPGVQIESDDSGPGIADVERAITDGFSTAGSLGYGLGTVHRLLDTCTITSQPGKGTHIVGQRRLPLAPVCDTALDCLTFGVATRPCQGFEVNGDAFIVKRWNGSVMVGVIDGLGHGPFAQRAAATARHFVESHYEQPLDELFRGVARVCRPTRGVVMALARFDVRLPNTLDLSPRTRAPSPVRYDPSALRLTFGSIGNIETRVLRSPDPVNLPVRRGVLGGMAPAPLITEHAWDSRGMLLLHSDGMGTRWRWEDFPGLVAQPAATIAHSLLQTLAKAEDDATVVVIKGMES